ncbi:scavenger receptor cysteine-rich domain-containing protein DMBT1-like isoform X1 [Asterias amurensis]|uniref:scavenger receptor cysteine-rich domain-containing protein DMBT1-like isoform X1 n=1 Tax=Asterias amurensis TaxID=7602 RepID=UPI003AB75654
MTRLQLQTSFLLAFSIFAFLNGGVNGQQVDYSIRLQGGLTDFEGRVEIYYQGSWGTICDDQWDNNDATVVCQQLGYLGTAVAKTEAFFGEGTGDIVLDDVDCVGTESFLGRCQAKPLGDHNCGHGEDAGVVCSSPGGEVGNSIRLVGGSNDLEGRVEVFYKGAWGTVCDDEWDIRDAGVVCRQLGFHGTATPRVSSYFGGGSGDIVLDNVQCLGTELYLAKCPSSTKHNCGHTEDAGVTCTDDDVTVGLPIRLEGGSSELEGRVEIFYEGAWGTVCDDSWDDMDAQVVCRQLGFLGHARALESAHFGTGTGEILMDNVQCVGTELTLGACVADIAEHNCAHSEDASVICSDGSNVIEDYSIRLRGGGTSHEGRVEVFLYGEWGTVCDDDWGINDARVICRQLGFPKASYAKTSAYFGEGQGEILLDNVACSGFESHLRDCEATRFTHNCGHGEDAGVICSDEDGNFVDSAETWGKVRLVGGDTANDGAVEVFIGGRWDKVCDDEWDTNDAEVVCHQLGYKGARGYTTSATYPASEGSKFVMSDVACAGSETRLVNCPYDSTPTCFYFEVAGVQCEPPMYGDIRLFGGNLRSEGRLEIYTTNGWGTVCDQDWHESDAEVVCRELGFTGVTTSNLDGDFGVGNYPIAVTSVYCSGLENQFVDCQMPSMETSSFCTHDNDVAIKCSTPANIGETIGIIVGILIGLVLLISCCWCCCKASPKDETTTVTAAAPVTNGAGTREGYIPVSQSPGVITHPPVASYSPAQNTVSLNPSGQYVEPPPPTYQDVITTPSAYPVTIPVATPAYPGAATAPPLYEGYPAPNPGAPAYPPPSQTQMAYPPPAQPYPPPAQPYPPPSGVQQTIPTQSAPSGDSELPYPTTQSAPSGDSETPYPTTPSAPSGDSELPYPTTQLTPSAPTNV